MKTCKKYSVRVLLHCNIGVFWVGISGLWMCASCSAPPRIVDTGQMPPQNVKFVQLSSLTEFVTNPISNETSLKILVELWDADNSSIQTPCAFRFELYEFAPLSGDSRGKRILLWPQQDLTDPEINNTHWNQVLGGYEFLLPAESRLVPGRNYVLEVTCLLGQRRLGNTLKIKGQP